jgi:ribosomal-protein-alanine N-acetyltransferase
LKLPSTLNLKIRGFKQGDLAELSSIEKASFKDPYPSTLILTLSRLSPQYFLVAEVSGKPVGYISALAQTKGVAHLFSLAVHPQYRKLGVARSLLKALISRLRAGGFTRLILEVRISNRPAITLYKSLGFKPAGRIPSYYENGEDAQTMILTLSYH